jgi:hypothetical protein
MSETIQGKAKFVDGPNKWGFYSVNVDGTKYGLGKKRPSFKSGDKVKFEAEQDDKGYWNVKGNVLSKAGEPEPAGGSKAASSGGRDGYWEAKDAYDKQTREPRIAYQGALDRAIAIFKIVDAKGGYPGLAKIKPTAILTAVEALIDSQAERIMALSAVAAFPKAKTAVKEEVEAGAEEDDEAEPEAAATDDSWEE